METNYNASRLPNLRALARDHGLRGYSRLRKAELITFLWDKLRLMSSPRPPLKPIPAPRLPSKPMLAPMTLQSIRLQPKCTRPPKTYETFSPTTYCLFKILKTNYNAALHMHKLWVLRVKIIFTVLIEITRKN